MRKPNPNQHEANQTTALKILKQVGWQVLDCLLYIGSVVVFFTHVILGGHNCQKTLHENPQKLQTRPQRPRRLAASFPKKSSVMWPARPNCTLKRLPEKKRRGNQNEKEMTPPETENKGIFAQDKARKKRERRRTYLRKVLPYTSNFSSNLCRCVFLASEP